MRLLDRYLLRELLVPFIYCLGGFLILWVSSDLLNELSTFQKLELTASDLVKYYLIKTPEMLVIVLPVALLLALLYALTTHARHFELTAIRAAGVSLTRLAAPYLGVGMLLSVGVFAMNELWVPQSLEASDVILASRRSAKLKSTGQEGQWVKNLGFRNAPAGRKWFMDAFNMVTSEMVKPYIVWDLPDGTRRVIFAERADYVDGVWTFKNVRRGSTILLKSSRLNFNET